MAEVQTISIKSAKASLDDVTYTIEGYLAVYNNPDLGNDVIEPGAIDPNEVVGTPILWSHDFDHPIGVWQEAKSDNFGLWVRGQLVKGVRKADEAVLLYKAQALKGLSIGYKTLDAEYDYKTDIRYLKKISVKEGSVVVRPMNPEAQITNVKSANVAVLTELHKGIKAIFEERKINV